MQTRQYRLAQDATAWDAVPAGELADAQLVLAFGPSPDGQGGVPGAAWFAAMAERWPEAARLYCSTGGHKVTGGLAGGDDRLRRTVVALDGEPALALYKRYLGPLAAELPASGLLFPLALRTRDADTGVVRMVLGIDEAANAVRFAGDVPEGTYVRLMKASPDRLIDAASEATELADARRDEAPDAVFALVVSCVGRRWVLRQRVEEELEAVRDALGGDPCLAGFYSYGEVAPARVDGGCEYHNQTMTLTTFRER